MGRDLVSVYQNYYNKDQITNLDKFFIPYDWTGNPTPEYREIAIFFDLYNKREIIESEYFGLVSPKFYEKTGITGDKFIDFIIKNPGYDVYFINPFPHGQYLFFNVWEQGEQIHPGTKQMTQELFDYAGYDISIEGLGRSDRTTASYCNYWVGNKAFWDVYISFIKPLFECITVKMPDNQRKKYFELAPYTNPAPYFPFVFERMFSTILLINKKIKSLSYEYSKEEYNNLEKKQNFKFYGKCSSQIKSIDYWDASIRGHMNLDEQKAQFDLLKDEVMKKYNYMYAVKKRLSGLLKKQGCELNKFYI